MTDHVQSKSEFNAGWRTLLGAACGVGVGVTGSVVYSAGVFLNPVSEEFGWTRAEISAGGLFTVCGLIVTAPFIGRLTDRIGVRAVGMTSLAFLAGALVAMTQVNAATWTFYLGLFLISVFGSGTTPIVWARGVASWFDKNRGLALAVMLLGTGAAGVLTPIFVGSLIENYGWRTAYVGMGAVALIAIIPVYILFHEKKSVPAHAIEESSAAKGLTVREALSTRQFWLIAASFALIAPAISALLVHLVALLTDSGVARPTALKVAGFLGIAVIIGRLSVGFLVDRYYPPFVAAAFFLLPTVGCILAALNPGSVVIMTLATASFGLAAGAEIDLLAFLVSRYFGLRNYSAIYGCQFAIFEIGVGMGPWLAGRSFDTSGSYEIALLVGAVMFIAGGALLAFLGHPRSSFSSTRHV